MYIATSLTVFQHKRTVTCYLEPQYSSEKTQSSKFCLVASSQYFAFLCLGVSRCLGGTGLTASCTLELRSSTFFSSRLISLELSSSTFFSSRLILSMSSITKVLCSSGSAVNCFALYMVALWTRTSFTKTSLFSKGKAHICRCNFSRKAINTHMPPCTIQPKLLDGDQFAESA